MPSLTNLLRSELRSAQRICVLGVGSDLRGDDAVGLVVAARLRKALRRRTVCVLNGGTAPENLTGEIRRFDPSHLLIVDALDSPGAPGPGSVVLLAPDEITGPSFGTHKLPIKLMVRYLLHSLPGRRILIVGIQPKSLAMAPMGLGMAPLTRPVAAAATRLTRALLAAIRQ